MSRRPKLRVGAVSYLNTKPLVFGLPESSELRLSLDYPSRLAEQLAAAELDVALIPSVEFLRGDGYSLVSTACIACRGPVWSVKLLFRVPPERVRTLALDEGSRTSAALAKVLLHGRYGIQPACEPLPLGASHEDTSADAVLLIGDRAMHTPAGLFCEIWDLGDQWCRWTELPFVFAVWAARPGIDTTELALRLDEARDAGLANLETIAQREAAPLGLTEASCKMYLGDYLHFTLGPRERRGLALFERKATALGLVPKEVTHGSVD
jgi:chorismate dehydratase